MKEVIGVPTATEWFEKSSLQNVTEITKQSPDTRAWFAVDSGREIFLKFYPHEFAESRAAVEVAIAGAHLHPAIIPLRETVHCLEGVLLIYDRVFGENLGPMDVRGRFQALPLVERVVAVSVVFSALADICEAGFMVVDWYEGNMIYDFSEKRMWLFDWELCRKGVGFTLEMDSNYGSSRLMAPEEFVRGSWLDQQTIVFNLGRYGLITLPELADRLAPVLGRATYPARAGRYSCVREFTQAFFSVISLPGRTEGAKPLASLRQAVAQISEDKGIPLEALEAELNKRYGV
jgi:serine/threonine-protein kinase